MNYLPRFVLAASLGVFASSDAFSSALIGPLGLQLESWSVNDLIDIGASCAAMAASLVCVWQLRRRSSLASGANKLLSALVSNAELGPDNGVLFLDGNRRILAASSLLTTLAVKDGKPLVGKTVEQAYPSRFSRFILDLQERALVSRGPVPAEIVDWTPYELGSLGPVQVTASPSMSAGLLACCLINFRSAKELRLIEETANRYQAQYQTLLDTLPVGVAIFRPISSTMEDGADFALLEANEAFKNSTGCTAVKFNEPCTSVWHAFNENRQLREGFSRIQSGLQSFRLEFVAPASGRYLDFRLTRLLGDKILGVVLDRTEQRLSEDQVLHLNDQLKQVLAKKRQQLDYILEDIDRFNEATSDRMASCLEDALTLKNVMPEVFRPECSLLIEKVQNLFTQVMEYHSVTSFPYGETQLVQIGPIIQPTIENLQKNSAYFLFELKPTALFMASPAVIDEIFKRALAVVSQLPHDRAARVEVGEYSDFLNAGFYVEATGFDASSLFVDLSSEVQPLDWTVSGDLGLAMARRMVHAQGGALAVAAVPNGFRLLVTVGTPP